MRNSKIRRFLAASLCASMIASCSMLTAFAADEDSKTDTLLPSIDQIEQIEETLTNSNNNAAKDEVISIAFKIGDSTLKINGENVTVTTPYEKDGTTLVPVRVITEAFGAQVDWSDAEQKVTLTYQGVVIEIWINSTRAVVNGIEQKLLLAPELTNDTTMVPLRFITENFGADVSYDDATESILVEKTVTSSEAISDYSNILHNTEKDFVGDSYYGWSMKYSKEYNISYRNFSGELTILSNDDGSSSFLIFVISVPDATENEAFSSIKDAMNSQTVIVQKTETAADGLNYFYGESKTSSGTTATKAVLKDGKMYQAYAKVDNEASSSVKDEAFEILKTFSATTADFSKVADLSEVVDGYRPFESKDFNFSMTLPAYMFSVNDSDKINEFLFMGSSSADEEILITSVNIQSTDNASVDSWIERDYSRNVKSLNPDYADFSEIQNGTLAGMATKYYTYIIHYEDGDKETQDIFFELGDYVYNVAVAYSVSLKAEAEKIKSSMKFSSVDKAEMGSLMVTDSYESTQKHTVSGITFSAPSDYTEMGLASNMLMLLSSNGSELYVAAQQKSNIRIEDLVTSTTQSLLKNYTKIKEIKPCIFMAFGDKKGYTQVTEIKDNNDELYILEVSAFTVDDYTVRITRMIPIIEYGEDSKAKLNDIAASVSVAK